MKNVWTLAFLSALTVFSAASQPRSAQAQENTDKEAAPEQKLRQDLLGAWALAGGLDSTVDPEPGARMKFWGLGHWVITQSDPITGQVIFHHGGTYTLVGDRYEEKIEFAGESTSYLIGRKFKYKIKIDGDTYTQIGVGNEFSERWVRLKAK